MLREGIRKIIDKFRPRKKTEAEPVCAFQPGMNAKTLSEDAMEAIASLSSIGPRLSLSKEERMAGNRVLSMLEENGTEAEAIEFRAENMTQVLWGRIVGYALPLVPVLMMAGQPLFALLLALFIGAVFWFDGIREKGMFSRFMKKKTGIDIRGTVEPVCEEKARIIFTSHLDSARLFRADGANKYIYGSAGAIALGAVASFFMTLYEAIEGCLFRFNFNIWVNIIVSLPLLALSIWSIRLSSIYSDKVSPGVGDNLTGVGVCLALDRYFENSPLKSTAVEFAFFSSEETGKAGSRKYFSEREKDDAVVINVDAIYGRDDLAVLMSDGNGMVKLDEKLALDIAALADRMGYRMKTGKLSFLSGSTDAMNASLAGYRATTVTSMIPGSVNPGHTSEDTVDHIDRSALESVIAVLIRYAEDSDRKFTPEAEKKEESGFLSSDKTYMLYRE